jgi:hypothetical protein
LGEGPRAQQDHNPPTARELLQTFSSQAGPLRPDSGGARPSRAPPPGSPARGQRGVPTYPTSSDIRAIERAAPAPRVDRAPPRPDRRGSGEPQPGPTPAMERAVADHAQRLQYQERWVQDLEGRVQDLATRAQDFWGLERRVRDLEARVPRLRALEEQMRRVPRHEEIFSLQGRVSRLERNLPHPAAQGYRVVRTEREYHEYRAPPGDRGHWDQWAEDPQRGRQGGPRQPVIELLDESPPRQPPQAPALPPSAPADTA